MHSCTVCTISTPWGVFLLNGHGEGTNNDHKGFRHPTGTPFLSWVMSGKCRLMPCQRTLGSNQDLWILNWVLKPLNHDTSFKIWIYIGINTKYCLYVLYSYHYYPSEIHSCTVCTISTPCRVFLLYGHSEDICQLPKITITKAFVILPGPHFSPGYGMASLDWWTWAKKRRGIFKWCRS